MKKLLILLSCLFFFLFLTGNVFAQEKINSFNSDITVDSQGVLSVHETITYDFGNDEKHGIFRRIDKSQEVTKELIREISVEVESVKRDGQNEEYLSTEENNQSVIKIGNPSRTISGPHVYEVIYTVKNSIGNFEDHDEVYWNVNGNQWEVLIENIQLKLFVNFETEIDRSICYTGEYGSTEQSCSIAEDNNTYVVTAKSLKPSQGLTAAFSFPADTFPKSILMEKKPDSLPFYFFYLIGALILLYFVVLPLILIVVFFRKKRKSSLGKITVNFDIPKDKGKVIPPAEAGTIDTARLEQNDIIATIFDLAIKGYIKIIEKSKKKSLLGIGQKQDYLLKKTKEYRNKQLTEYEEILMDKLFEDRNEVLMSSLSKKFYSTYQKMDESVFRSLIQKGFYNKNPKIQLSLFMTFAILSLFTLNFLLSGTLFFFYKTFNGRTKLGDEVDWRIDGLKLFLKSMDRNYKWHAEQLALVEKMIPYAIALGYINKFMEQLKIIRPDYNPSWYSGRGPFYLSATSLYSSMSTGIRTNAPSSSSGFSSGGFSGGGSGGGGGGSW